MTPGAELDPDAFGSRERAQIAMESIRSRLSEAPAANTGTVIPMSEAARNRYRED